jgi:diamine N-acetyltransferase
MNENRIRLVTVDGSEAVKAVAGLAREIWTEHYTPIIGREQVEYMLSKFQSEEAIAEQIRQGSLYFLVSEEGDYPGYFAVEVRDQELFLSKIYVRLSHRRRGFGREMITFIERLAHEMNLAKISLTVNKGNTASIEVYEKMGFVNLGPVVKEIGNGFVMDDYRMEKHVSRASEKQ